jgi:hypothetical protein
MTVEVVAAEADYALADNAASIRVALRQANEHDHTRPPKESQIEAATFAESEGWDKENLQSVALKVRNLFLERFSCLRAGQGKAGPPPLRTGRAKVAVTATNMYRKVFGIATSALCEMLQCPAASQRSMSAARHCWCMPCHGAVCGSL